jgi:hypothetical protein
MIFASDFNDMWKKYGKNIWIQWGIKRNICFIFNDGAGFMKELVRLNYHLPYDIDEDRVNKLLVLL